MPLMHVEELAVQEAALLLFERFIDPPTAALGRMLSSAELAFLQTHGSRF